MKGEDMNKINLEDLGQVSGGVAPDASQQYLIKLMRKYGVDKAEDLYDKLTPEESRELFNRVVH